MKEEKVDILLSTYNGEKYLPQQLDSLLAQTYINWQLIIRDDGSQDRTPIIIEEYIDRYPNKICLLHSDGNIGVVKSFETLLGNSNSKYIMFCDQDDIWLSDKIAITHQKMLEEEKRYPTKPVLIHTDLTVVNDCLEIIHTSFWQYSRINPELLTNIDFLSIHNAATGCTIMINENAKMVIPPFTEKTLMHDSWIALSVAKKMGIISFVNRPTMLYRQHASNAVGARNSINNYFLNRILTFKGVIKYNTLQYKMINELENYSIIRYIYNKIKYFKKNR